MTIVFVVMTIVSCNDYCLYCNDYCLYCNDCVFILMTIVFIATLKPNFHIRVFTRNSSFSSLNVRNSSGFKVSWVLTLWAAWLSATTDPKTLSPYSRSESSAVPLGETKISPVLPSLASCLASLSRSYRPSTFHCVLISISSPHNAKVFNPYPTNVENRVSL